MNAIKNLFKGKNQEISGAGAQPAPLVNLTDKKGDEFIEGAGQTELAFALLPYILPAIYDLKYSATPDECMSRIYEMAGISVKSQLLPWNGKTDRNWTKVVYCTRWARQYLRDAGYLEGGFGKWVLTDLALDNRAHWLEPDAWPAFRDEMREDKKRRAREFNRSRAENAAKSAVETAGQEQDDHENQDLDKNEPDAASLTKTSTKMQAVLDLNDAQKQAHYKHNLAENLISVVAENLGFVDCKTTPKSHDGGIDLWVNEKLGPFEKIPVAFQMKNWGTPVDLNEVQKFAHVCGEKGVRGVLIATSGFRDKVGEWVQKNHHRAPITLISGKELIRHMDDHNIWDVMAHRPGYSSFKEFTIAAMNA